MSTDKLTQALIDAASSVLNPSKDETKTETKTETSEEATESAQEAPEIIEENIDTSFLKMILEKVTAADALKRELDKMGKALGELSPEEKKTLFNKIDKAVDADDEDGNGVDDAKETYEDPGKDKEKAKK